MSSLSNCRPSLLRVVGPIRRDLFQCKFQVIRGSAEPLDESGIIAILIPFGIE